MNLAMAAAAWNLKLWINESIFWRLFTRLLEKVLPPAKSTHNINPIPGDLYKAS